MKKFHISFYEEEGSYASKGENFEAEDELQALIQFRDKYPSAIFLCCISPDVIRRA